ncbi:stabilizer of axonemal microtubules 3 [Eretmochelys imbricata]
MAGTILPTPAGTDLGWSIEEARWHHGRDWPLTSSGVGLENRPPQPFPPPAARSTVHQPLPPGAERPLREELIRRLATTTGLCHDVKTHGGVLGQPGYPLPAPLGRVHCNKDLRDKSMVASTENKPLAGSVFYVRDGAVLSRLDPYVSITSRDVRAFTPQELQGYARKDALTYWQFEAPPALPAYPCWPLLFHTGGALSLAQESYGPPHHTPSGQGPPNPGPPPSAPPMTGPQILAVPLMYRTESQGYGSSKPGPV